MISKNTRSRNVCDSVCVPTATQSVIHQVDCCLKKSFQRSLAEIFDWKNALTVCVVLSKTFDTAHHFLQESNTYILSYCQRIMKECTKRIAMKKIYVTSLIDITCLTI